jgi:hypothetical protein
MKVEMLVSPEQKLNKRIKPQMRLRLLMEEKKRLNLKTTSEINSIIAKEQPRQ